MKFILKIFAVLLLLTSALHAEEALINILKSGAKAEIETAIKNGLDPNHAEKNGVTALMVAAQNNNIEAVKVLIKNGAKVNARNSIGATALMAAIGNTDIVEVLIAAGADVNMKGAMGVTTLMLAAAASKDISVLEALLKAKADISAKDDYGRTAFDYAENNHRIKGTSVYWKLSNSKL